MKQVQTRKYRSSKGGATRFSRLIAPGAPPDEIEAFGFSAGGDTARLCIPSRMTDSQIIGEIAAQHALLLELANQKGHTRAAVSALAELMISQAPRRYEYLIAMTTSCT